MICLDWQEISYKYDEYGHPDARNIVRKCVETDQIAIRIYGPLKTGVNTNGNLYIVEVSSFLYPQDEQFSHIKSSRFFFSLEESKTYADEVCEFFNIRIVSNSFLVMK